MRTLLRILIIKLTIISSLAFNVVNINLLIKKPLEDSLIGFIKLPYIHNLKIKNNTKYLILNYLDDPKNKFIDKLDNTLYKGYISVKDDDNKIINFIENNNGKDETIKGVEYVEQEQNNSFFNVYETIKNNKKPLIIINKKNRNNINSKYLYLIKSKYEYVMRYSFDYNNHRYKYYFNIDAKPIDNYETLWDISAFVKDYSTIKTLSIIGYYVKNWIEHNIYNNMDFNNFYKRYLVLYFFLNS